MKKNIAVICSALLLLLLTNPLKADLGPRESIPKLDSLLNLRFDANTFKSTVNEIAKYDKVQSQKIDSAIQFVYTINYNWAMTGPYQTRMGLLRYWQLPNYALMVEQEYLVWQKIQKEYPATPIIDGEYNRDDRYRVISLKPVIYLYPDKEQKVEVQLGFKGKDLYTWPHVNESMYWNVTAQASGMLKDTKGEEYPYLFWEGEQEDMSYVDNSEGFVMKGTEVEGFLVEKLKLLGLNARERTDFITFWVPRMQANDNLFIRFETTAYDKAVPLNVLPKPDSMQRVFMVWRKVPAGHTCKPKELTPFTRNGFTLIEWGGSQLPEIVN